MQPTLDTPLENIKLPFASTKIQWWMTFFLLIYHNQYLVSKDRSKEHLND